MMWTLARYVWYSLPHKLAANPLPPLTNITYSPHNYKYSYITRAVLISQTPDPFYETIHVLRQSS